MRDVFFVLVFPLILYAVFKRPFIGAAMWLWVAMFFPNGWVYGFAGSFRYNFIIVVCAVISYIFWNDKEKNEKDTLTFLILLFLLWTFITSIFTLSISEIVWSEWIEFLKITLLFVFTVIVVRTQLHLNVLIWALVLSIGFYGCLEGLKYIVSGGAHRISGLQGHILGDRNELALAFNMLLPLLAYLITITKLKVVKFGLFCTVVLTIVAIIGTYSRGGTLALIIVGGYFWLQSKHKLFYTIILVISLTIASNYIPSSWSNRMDTLETAQQDSSFLGRVLAWKQAVLMANDNPFTGGGFKAGQTEYLWWSYNGAHSFNDIVDTSHMDKVKLKAAHSIYFQVLGDHGFVGLLIFLSIIITAYTKMGKNIKLAKKYNSDKNIILLCKYLKVSLIAYCAGGAGVSLAYFDMLYVLLAMTVVIEHKVILSNVKNLGNTAPQKTKGTRVHV
jgi:probable O-glycosylation ligase (exosortase A-associated)